MAEAGPIGPLIGTAGWSVPTAFKARFPGEGTHLHRFLPGRPARRAGGSASGVGRRASGGPAVGRACATIGCTARRDYTIFAYDDAFLPALAQRLRAEAGAPCWCVFDNTASGAAAADALRLRDLLLAQAPIGQLRDPAS